MSQRQVVVVTGASSGIGRATAVEFASRGALVVLAARREEALKEVAELCRAAGGSAIFVPTDVTREEDVQNLLKAALDAAGRIDVWINNAGVTLFALLEKGSFEEHRRVIETNLYGAILSARAVVPVFRRQRRGVLINVGSILSKIAQPVVPSYVISKFGLRGVSEALRSELADERDIHVCTVFPYAVNTQHFESGANELGREIDAMPPVQDPKEVARAIAELAEHPRRERHVPRYAAFGLALHRVLPGTVERLLAHSIRRFHVSDRRTPQQLGNLYRPAGDEAKVEGARPPTVDPARFTRWTLRELLRIEADSVRRLFRRRPTEAS
jgi:NAD(P)-dependent dehydrogenase (short-subunit alcohol dehydrogenase family)